MRQFKTMQMNSGRMCSGMWMMCGMFLRGKKEVLVLCMECDDKRFAG